MLRSLYSGISGLRAHQTMLDVTGNNIANVNTAGFKSSTVQFQDTLSQVARAGAAAQAGAGGTNPAQVGLGVQVAGVSTNFSQGSAQATGRSSDMMISGDGFFITSKGGEQLYARAGAFDFDSQGRLVSPDGALLQGWSAVNGQVNAGAGLNNIVISKAMVAPAEATTGATMGGNLPEDAALNTELTRDMKVFDANGTPRNVTLTFTRTGTGWDVTGADANGAAGATALTFANGAAAPGSALTVGGISVDLSGVTGFAGLSTVAVTEANGNAAGTLDSFSMGADGTLTGTFSNGENVVIGRIALANFTNAGGLEKAGSSSYRETASSGAATVGAAGTNGLGALTSGYVEMSNVDLSQEFTNLIVAQRGFQSNARIITTSDEVLQELTQLKR
ncbi:flagellar hook protein FlgE [Arthrobacter glacialis]|uniref:Flagellar hook protein FlgE n=1 Tax=Arthrobacter glacialis TaxID=1664 RepID=A0A2S3ZX63_ARTGL|nr:flagellar hook protein FlgE [Arthrobacter glacialis]POH59383.1 flagellar hook protein [Arthrobacter glacialis]POH73851.1 flagellar hook protein [Arthrobacter glacialis]